MKPVQVVLSPEAGAAYALLEQEAAHHKPMQSIANAVRRKAELIKANPHYGEPLAKRLIPAVFAQKYGATNLFRVELPSYWRLLYTLTNSEDQASIIALVLAIVDHPTYERLMGYKEK